MKKLLIVVVALVALTSCNQSKIGYVDVSKLMKEYDAVKDLEKEMTKKSDDFQAKYQQIAGEMDAQIKAGKMSQKEAQEKGQQLQMAYQQEGQQLQKESQDRSDEIIDDVKAFVKDYAKKNKYSFILGSNESGNVLYGEDKADLTETLIDVINADYENGGKTVKAAKEEVKDTAKAEKK